MKKITYLLTMVLAVSLFSISAFADGELGEMLTKKESSQTTKKSRRTKVQMCNECGKPEPQCECEGHHDEDETKVKSKK